MLTAIGILQTSSRVRYGINKQGHYLYRFVAYKPTTDSLITVASKLHAQLCDYWVEVEYDTTTANQGKVRGYIVSILGTVGDPVVELQAICRHYRSRRMTQRSLKPCEDEVLEIMERERTLQADEFRTLAVKVCSIDPDGCMDVDDAFSFDTSTGILGIHIADVSYWIHPDTHPHLDARARTLGETLYDWCDTNGETNSPMFPRILADDIMSLREGVVRPALSLYLRYDRNTRTFTPDERTVVKTWVINTNATTYEDYDPVANGTADVFHDFCDYVLGANATNQTIHNHKIVEAMMIYC